MNFNDYPYRGQYGFPSNWPVEWPYWDNLILYPPSTTAGTSLTYSGLIVPEDVHHVLALVWGGGGSGAGSPGTQDGSSTGGGGGGFAAGIIDCVPGQQLPDVIIGGPTNGTSGAVGSTGSTSSIGNLIIATGGLGGVNAATSTAAAGPIGGSGNANLRIGFTAIGGYGGSTSGLGATSRRATGGGGPGWFWTSNPADGKRNRGGDTTQAHALSCGTGGGGLGGRGGDSAQILTANQATAPGGLGGNGADHNATTGNLNGAGGSRGDGNNAHPTAGPGFFSAYAATALSAITTNATIASMDRYEAIHTFRVLINMFAFGGHNGNAALKIREFYIGGYGAGTANSAGTINAVVGLGGGNGGSFGGTLGVAGNSAGAVTATNADFFAGGGGAANVGAGACTGGNGGVAGGGGGARNGSTGAACTGGQGGGGFAILAWVRGF